MVMTAWRETAGLRAAHERSLRERAAEDLAHLLDVQADDPHKAAEDADRLDVYRAREALKLAVSLAHWQATALAREAHHPGCPKCDRLHFPFCAPYGGQA